MVKSEYPFFHVTKAGNSTRPRRTAKASPSAILTDCFRHRFRNGSPLPHPWNSDARITRRDGAGLVYGESQPHPAVDPGVWFFLVTHLPRKGIPAVTYFLEHSIIPKQEEGAARDFRDRDGHGR